MSTLDEDFDGYLAAIEEGKANFGEDEQTIIDAWVAKISEPKDTDEEKTLRNEYAHTLAKLTTEEKQLLPPFSTMPYDGDLTPLSDAAGPPPEAPAAKPAFQIRKLPCSRVKPAKSAAGGSSTKPKMTDAIRKPQKSDFNEFSDPDEMAKIIARSKGQTFPEFVASISRHTPDFGQTLRKAMKTETANFKEFVDHVLSQRIKDLTEVLDEEQNAELQKIKKDIDKWQLELSYCKKRIKQIIPDFDLDEYKRDKDYLLKMFALDNADSSGQPLEDSYKTWKEETCHRLKWYSEMIYKITRSNDCTAQEISDIKSRTLDLETRETMKQQNSAKYLNCELAEYQKLKAERDRLNKETSECLAQLEGD